MSTSDYLEKNRQSWNKRTELHIDSEFYDMPGFLAGKTSLNEIELNLLGDIQGKRILHLQCHFGQDTLSFARMGAKATGVDLSDAAIAKAKALNDELGLDAQFVCCDLYSAPKHVEGKFDIVFTSYGTIGWLPDLDQWASVVKHFLKEGGTFMIIEFHPVVWMFDDDFTEIKYSYNKSMPIEEVVDGSYAAKDAEVKLESISWNHGLAEVVQSLLAQGLQIKDMQEYDYSPYDCFDHTVKIAERKYRIKHLANKIPMVYSILAKNP